MEYQSLIKNLLNEAKEGIRYNQLEKPMRILTIIAMLPVLALNCILIAMYYVLLFFYNALLCPVNYLEKWQEQKKDTVKHATQAVIYLVSTPFIFFCRAILSFVSFYFYFLWFEIMAVTYLSTLGGIKWQPFINTATFDKKYNWELKPNANGTKIYGVVSFIMFVLWLLFALIVEVAGIYELSSVGTFITVVYFVTIIVVNPILFKKTEKVEEVKSEENLTDLNIY